MSTIRLPGLIDAHVHMREPGYTYKEDFASGTAAALAGGVTIVLDMPNTAPPTATPEHLAEKAALARSGAVCDVGLFVGATSTDLDAYIGVADRACGLKIYVNDTFGSLRIDELGTLHRLFRSWAQRAATVGGWRCDLETSDGKDELADGGTPTGLGPIAVHAEELMVPACIALSDLYAVPLHVVHVSRRSEIELIRRAKERGSLVTCEASPHHLLYSRDDLDHLGSRGDMRPRLASPDDVVALWEHLEAIDLFATDHAPHTLEEKQGDSPPPGVPGVQTLLPLLLTWVHDGRLTLDDISLRAVDNPRRIYGLPAQPETYVEIDPDAAYTLADESMISRVGWTPFAGRPVRGRIERVVLRGETVFDGERVLARPGSGRVLFHDQQ